DSDYRNTQGHILTTEDAEDTEVQSCSSRCSPRAGSRGEDQQDYSSASSASSVVKFCYQLPDSTNRPSHHADARLVRRSDDRIAVDHERLAGVNRQDVGA